MLGWVPIRHVVGVREALRETVGGDDEFVGLIKDLALRSISRPPFNVMSAAILRIYKKEPVTLLRGYARIWNSIYRGAGTYSVESSGPRRARVLVEGASPQFHDRTLRAYCLGIFLAVVEIGRRPSPQGRAWRPQPADRV